jgi:hypothetical protein
VVQATARAPFCSSSDVARAVPGHGFGHTARISNMNVQEFLKSAKNTRPRKGSAGKESRWLHCCDFNLRGEHLQMVETRILGAAHDQNCVSIPAPPGSYVVECRLMAYGNERRISRMRVRPHGATPALGASAGAITVDLGGIAVTDVDILASFVEEHQEEYVEWMEGVVSRKLARETVGVLRWKRVKTEVPFAQGGFGDGMYQVFRLMSAKQAVGLEVEFIAPGTKYPF